jgi:hypothetical protein
MTSVHSYFCRVLPDGSYAFMFGAAAATADALGQRHMAGTQCATLVIRDDAVYYTLKFGVDSFEGCPFAPTLADFEADGGAGKDWWTLLATSEDIV